MKRSDSGKTIFIVAGETSGDALGARLIDALKARRPDLRFAGVGGEAMRKSGLDSLFAMSDIAVMGFFPVIARLPLLLRRISQTAQACVAANPAALIIIDSPDFTHRVARKVRAEAPGVPIIDYVSPTVWAWRPGRARAMRAYVDALLAVLPFEPAVHRRLGGPVCHYVGHPLIERLGELRPSAEEARERDAGRLVLVMPGSRASEVIRLLPVMGEAVRRIAEAEPAARFVLPVVPHLRERIAAGIAGWPVKPEMLLGEADKLAAFRRARAAMVASGTATLELALSGIPMVTLYKASRLEAAIVRAMIQVRTGLLPHLVLGEHFIPEFLQEHATAQALTGAILPLVQGGRQRDEQLAAFVLVDAAMHVEGNNPSAAAAGIVLDVIGRS